MTPAHSGGVFVKYNVVKTPSRTGNGSLQITVGCVASPIHTYTENLTQQWAVVRHRFAKPIILMGNRALRAWVFGGSGATLNLQLQVVVILRGLIELRGVI